ncbi:hypothetical protein C2G38_365764 [Gigaspora rosea]|uniref:Uncharacterized protein n=1 Tax=Gigaspora rosea TaxID=44941 RepID=A0A397UGN1_9GLOM|nr:hypothetical protein C2G38_365764 [Gigaspora rosea]
MFVIFNSIWFMFIIFNSILFMFVIFISSWYMFFIFNIITKSNFFSNKHSDFKKFNILFAIVNVNVFFRYCHLLG